MRLNSLNIRRDRPILWKGAVAGVVGGLVASWTMNQFQTLLSKASEKISNGNGSSNKHRASENDGSDSDSGNDSEDATMKAADRVSSTVLGEPLSKEQKKKAGPAVHYFFGALMGGLYGAVVEHAPEVAMGEGAPFGTLLFLGADEVAVPAFGLSKPPQEYPLSTHASALASHLVYGTVTEVVRKHLRKELRKV